MKKILLVLLVGFIVVLNQPVLSFAQTPTVAPSHNQVPKDSKELENIQKIKEIVASRVAELDLVEKRGLLGSVKEINGMKIVITDIRGNSRNVDVDELTKFEFGDKDNTGISDLKKGQTYSFVGLYNKDTERLLARKIDSVDTIPVYFEGALKSINEEDYQLTIVNNEGKEITVDILSSTKTNLASKNGLIRSGFSKLNVNSRILAIGFWDEKDKSLLSATRVIHFENIPPAKEAQSYINVKEIDSEKEN